jgi:cysteinyl-tRNA synthetase
MTRTIRLHNSLTGKKEDFIPVDPTHVRLYACGPTVYNYAHIGNARMAVVFDQWVRLLRVLYPRVTYASNITDVDDKIMAAAAETGEDITAITQKYTQIYNDDMAALSVARPDIQPHATDHIPEMIALIEALIARNHAYVADGHVLFNVPSFQAYGRLSGRSRDDQIAGARVEIAPYKKDPADFVLWKPSTPDQPGWESPWGRGRPGWHIECSAMSEKHLGLPFDIHGGGADLKFPHHENEIAQSCCAHGHETNLEQFSKYWIHNGFVTVEGEKMSKSLGNFLLTHDLIQKYDGEVLRLAMLSAHYRQPLDWTEQGLHQAKKYLDRLYQILFDLKDIAPATSSVPDAILDDLCDDLNTPKALATLNDLSRTLGDKATLKAAILSSGALLGVLGRDPAVWLGYGIADDAMAAEIESLLHQRQEAKKMKDYARADSLRQKIESMGIVIEDTPAGPKWRRAG